MCIRDRAELAHIYEQRGVDAALAQEVARQLMAHDALGAHARDELGLSEHTSANPIQAALASALTFSAGAAVPLILAAAIALPWLMGGIGLGALLCLAVLGAIGAKAGGAPVLKPALRVTFWGILAMAATVGIGRLFGTLA